MNSSLLWNDVVPDKDGVKSSINDVAISPDSSRVIVAVGNRVLLYNGDNGSLIDSLRGHKDLVHSVDFSHDGTRFASGGADNTVIIWKSSGQGLLKFTHNTSIQKVKYSPTAIKLASCSEADFGIWTPEHTKVLKEKVSSRILSAAWTLDGSFLALGTAIGFISIRNQNCEEVSRIDRKYPVWCLLFVPNSFITPKSPTASSQNRLDNSDILICGCWQKVLSFYKMQNGSFKLNNEKNLGYYPCAISVLGSPLSKSSFLVISGSNKKASMYTKDGVRLAELSKKDSWIWGCASSLSGEKVVLGTNNGGIDCLQTNFVSVHALHKDRYAYRDNLTEIIVHHLLLDRKVRIKCKDLIRHISLYKNKLAVHLTDRVCIYESNPDDLTDMHFKVRRERMTLRPSSDFGGCDHMIVTSRNILFCSNNAIESYSFDGQRQRVWLFESIISYIKVDGGPDGNEGILVGLDSGVLNKIFIQIPFPIELTRCKNSIMCSDLSLDKSKLATVDSTGQLTVINVKTQDVLYSTSGVSSIAFNHEAENVLCYSSDKSISVVSGLGSTMVKEDGSSIPVPIEPQEQYIAGHVVGFQGQRIYCLHRGNITLIDVPQGKNMLKALDVGDSQSAYNIACLGVPESDWKLLALRALRENSVSVAKNAFARLKDMKFLNLVEQIQRHRSLSQGDTNTTTNPKQNALISKLPAKGGLDYAWNAELLAYEGHHNEAAKAYARMGNIDDALRILTDMRLWEDAILLSRSSGRSDTSELTMRQAQWFQETNDWKGAAELYVTLGNYYQAAKVVADASSENNDWRQVLIYVVRNTPVENTETLQFCGDFFASFDDDQFAREAYLKLGDISKLMQLYARRQMWDEAAKLADENEGKFDASVFLPYAEWLISKDCFEEAMNAYKKANRKDLAQKVLHELTKNAVSECRFKDAAYYYWLLSKEVEDANSTILQSQFELEADLYYAYTSVHSYVTDPFTNQQPEMLFQVSRFIINSLGNSETVPQGISKASTLYTLARQAMNLESYKLARIAFDKLTKLRLPNKKLEEIELDLLTLQAKPVRDNADHLPVCYRCGTSNPLLNPFTSKFAKGDVCTNCGHPFLRSFINFDILPLVEFVPEPSITDEEAIELIRQSPGDSKRNKYSSDYDSGWHEGKDGDADVIRFDSNYDDTVNDKSDKVDLFGKCLNSTLAKQRSSYIPITVDANTLISINRTEIYVCRPSSSNKRATFYRNMLPEIPVAISQPCHRFFHLEDFEFAYLSNKGCPYSRLKNVGEYGSL